MDENGSTMNSLTRSTREFKLHRGQSLTILSREMTRSDVCFGTHSGLLVLELSHLEGGRLVDGYNQ